MVLSRREFFQSGLCVTAVVMLSGCNSQIATEVVSDAKILADGLEAALSNIGSLNIPGLTPDKIQTVGLAVAGLEAVATALQGALSVNQAQPLVQQIETDLNAIVAALAGLPLPPPIPLALGAAAVLLPVIEAGVNLAITKLKTPPTAQTVSPDQARMILIGLKHK